jgi:hypothetical protein
VGEKGIKYAMQLWWPGLTNKKQGNQLNLNFFLSFFFPILRLELRVYTWRHFTSPFLR